MFGARGPAPLIYLRMLIWHMQRLDLQCLGTRRNRKRRRWRTEERKRVENERFISVMNMVVSWILGFLMRLQSVGSYCVGRLKMTLLKLLLPGLKKFNGC